MSKEDQQLLEEANTMNLLKTTSKARWNSKNCRKIKVLYSKYPKTFKKLDENSKRAEEGNITSSQARTLLSIKDKDERSKASWF